MKIEPSAPENSGYAIKDAIASETTKRSKAPIKMEKFNKKIVIILTAGFIITIVGITTGILWPSISDWATSTILTLTPTSINYNMWKETPIPMYFKVYLFNWTNPEDFNISTVKPNFVEMGPYTFHEKEYKVNMVWNNNDTITFQRKRVWIFDESLSNGSLSDKITNLNPLTATVAFSIRHKSKIIRELTDRFIEALGEKVTVTKSVRELLFEGYNDTLLRIAEKIKITDLPFDKFGWFYSRNASESYDGTFNILTGSSGIQNIGMMKEWNFNNKVNFYKDSCSIIDGSNGEIWPPVLNNNTISIFVSDICTSLHLVYDNATTVQGITGKKYIGDETMLDNGERIPSRKCYCPKGDCGPSGTLNISLCKFGSPAFVSMPHFYLADPSYTDTITGMTPSKDKHEMIISLEPNTGIPLSIAARMQVNLLVDQVEYMNMFQNAKKTYFPMLWFSQEIILTEAYATKVKLFLILPIFGTVTFFGIAGIGILVFLIGIFIVIRQRWRGEENQMLLSKQEDNIVHISNT